MKLWMTYIFLFFSMLVSGICFATPMFSGSTRGELSIPFDIEIKGDYSFFNHLSPLNASSLQPESAYNLFSISTLFKKEMLLSRGNRFFALFGGIYSAQERSFYPYPQELYYQWNWQQSSIEIGQKKHSWSLADSLWKDNLWLPTFAWNRSRPQEMGLIGLHWSRNTNRWKWHLFASTIHLPQIKSFQSISEDGQIISKSPWQRQLPQFISLANGVSIPIRYTIAKYDPLDFVLQPSMAFHVRWKKNNHNLRLSTAYKPHNNILLSVKPTVHIKNSSIEVESAPFQIKQYLNTLEWHTSYKKFDSFLSFTHSKYLNATDKTQPYFKDLFKDLKIIVASLNYPLTNAGEAALNISLKHTIDFKPSSASSIGTLDDTLFEYPYRYFEAIKIKLTNWKPLKLLPLSQDVDITYDHLQEGYSAGLTTYYQPKKGVRVSLGANWFKQLSKQTNNNFFTHRFKNNDFFSLGVSYEL